VDGGSERESESEEKEKMKMKRDVERDETDNGR
jgi:hypothetical protein